MSFLLLIEAWHWNYQAEIKLALGKLDIFMNTM